LVTLGELIAETQCFGFDAEIAEPAGQRGRCEAGLAAGLTGRGLGQGIQAVGELFGRETRRVGLGEGTADGQKKLKANTISEVRVSEV